MSTNKTVVLLGGKKDNSYSYSESGIGKTESISCNVAVRDTKPLINLRAAVLNNQLYICGGRFDTYRSNGTTECFKNDRGNWVKAPSMMVPRFSHTMTSVGSYILVTGGLMTSTRNINNARFATKSVEIFDGATWTTLPYTLSHRRRGHCAVPISETEVLVVGGSFRSPKHLVVEKYNIFTGMVARIPSLSLNRHGHACALLNGEVYISGGRQATSEMEYVDSVEVYDYEVLDSVEVLNLETLKWRNISAMNFPRESHTMENVNGELTVFGGSTDIYEKSPKNMLEKFIGNTWQLEEMKYFFSEHASVVLPCE